MHTLHAPKGDPGFDTARHSQPQLTCPIAQRGLAAAFADGLADDLVTRQQVQRDTPCVIAGATYQ